jgi:uncharacterized protein with HEPN domain
MNERIEKFLYDILTCVEKIQQYTAGMSLDEYLLDEKTQDAVERNFEIIGEAVNNIRKIDETIADQISDAPRIIGFRNHLIHGYDMISDHITWDIIQSKLPLLKQDIEQLRR